MRHTRSRTVLVGLSAATGAFAAAAMISAATAPTAHADDFSDILADIQAEQAAASTAFSDADADFDKGLTGVANGLAEYFVGLDDDTAGVADDIHVGLLDYLYGQPVIPASTFEFSITTPTIADYVAEAQSVYTTGMTDLTTYANDVSIGEYAQGAPFQDLGAIDIGELPFQIEVIGNVETLLAALPTF